MLVFCLFVCCFAFCPELGSVKGNFSWIKNPSEGTLRKFKGRPVVALYYPRGHVLGQYAKDQWENLQWVVGLEQKWRDTDSTDCGAWIPAVEEGIEKIHSSSKQLYKGTTEILSAVGIWNELTWASEHSVTTSESCHWNELDKMLRQSSVGEPGSHNLGSYSEWDKLSPKSDSLGIIPKHRSEWSFFQVYLWWGSPGV